MHNEFRETFSVAVKGGTDKEVKETAVKEVVAFANTEGGRLFIGVNDASGITGLKRDLKRYKRSADKLEL